MEKRKHSRIKVRWPIRISTAEGFVDGVTRNITVAGLFIQCEKALPENTPFTMTIMPPGKKAIEVKAKVIWSDLDDGDGKSTDFGMGFCFMEISEDKRRHLQDLIAMTGLVSP